MSEIRINTLDNKSVQNKIKNNEEQGVTDFKDIIKNSIEKVNNSQIESNLNIEKMAKGETGVHETMLSLQKADITLRLFLQIRNKAIDAYREIMRMPF